MKLNTIIEAILIAGETGFAFYDMEDAKIVYLMTESGADEENEELARQIEDTPARYRRIPTKQELHEFSIVKKFVDTIADEEIRSDLETAIQGKGAFRRFKNGIRRHKIEQQWYVYRKRAFREVAMQWCKFQKIEYEE